MSKIPGQKNGGDREPPAVARRGRPAGDRDARRADLLKAAMTVIARDGYAGASLRRVAEHAGCTTGAVTYYFASREEMTTALAESLFDDFDAQLQPASDTIDVQAILGRWVNRTKAADTELWLVLSQMLAYARHDSATAAIVQRRYAAFREKLAAILREGQRQGTVRSDIPADLLADQLSAISDGWMMMLPLEPERFRPKRIRALLDATAALVAPPPSRGSIGVRKS